MTTQHTPGPWELKPEECDKPYIRVRGTRFGGRYKIANVVTPVYEGVDEREADETRANARLIAAAPELLEALMACALIVETVAHLQGREAELLPYSDMARAAIAKATGETK